MKNLQHYGGNAFEFHKKVLDSKKDPTYKQRVTNLDDRINKRFVVYDENFTENILEEITCDVDLKKEKDDLLKLYSYKNSVIQRLKTDITTTDKNRTISTCPNCTISEISSFDHYLPKKEFPEFAVNPKNLFPSCSICNNYKNTDWMKNSKRLFLNLYLDKLPAVQYLFVKLTIGKDNVVATKFYLKNTGTIAPDIFEIIRSHYTGLHLLKRFSENSDSVVVPLGDEIESYIDKLSIEEIKKSVIERNKKIKLAFGYNYWKPILEIELMNNDKYLSRFQYRETK
jgi:5-methylcytosine-specific restriction endonuclease McrA